MTTLVTGGTGLVGFNIIEALLSEDREVRALVRSPSKARRVLPDDVDLVEGDVTDPASLARAMRHVTVVHHAAGLPEQWLRDESTFQDVNVSGTRHMIDAALEAGVERFVYTSTIDVFRADVGASYDESEIDPEPKPTAYERSKQDADRAVVEAMEARRLPAVLVHPAAVYGPGPVASAGLNDAIRKLRDGQVPALLPGGLPVVFAADVARVHLAAEGRPVGERFIASERYVELTELAEMVLRALGRPARAPRKVPLVLAKAAASIGAGLAKVTGKPPLVPKGQLQFLQWRARPRADRAREVLGVDFVPLEEGIERTLAFLARA